MAQEPTPLGSITVDHQVEATLWLHLPDGTEVAATAEHLDKMGFVNRRHAWDRGMEFFKRLVDVADHDDLTTAGSMVSQLIDYATLYDGDMDPNPTAPEGPWGEDGDIDIENEYVSAVEKIRRVLRKPKAEQRWPGGYRTPDGTQPVR